MPARGARRVPPSGRVVLTSGHLVDEPGRSPPRFPDEQVPAVAARIGALFEEWSVDHRDLVLSGGARGADILFAECALERGAVVRLLLALPPAQFVPRSVAAPRGGWEERFHRLLPRCRVDVLPDALRAAGQSPFEQVNRWMLDEAERLTRPLVAALVWDEQPAGGPAGTAGMAALLQERDVPTTVINPMAPGPAGAGHGDEPG
jgi:hypothetical protein